MPSNSPETIHLIASELEPLLSKHLGPNTYYVLIVSANLNPDDLCNCVSNIPPEKSGQLRGVFRELSTRDTQLLN